MNVIRFTAAEIAEVLSIPVNTVRRWASEDRWRRTDPMRRPVRYVWEDACDSFGQRKSGRTETLANIEAGRTRRLAS